MCSGWRHERRTLLDEPYLGLDVTARALLHNVLLRDYAAHPRTVVLSTHLIEESEALFDRVVIVDRGRIRVDSSRDETHNLAFTLSGAAASVDRLSAGFTILQSRAVSGLKSATAQGLADESTRALARELGVQIAPVSLQDAVLAFGADAPEPTENLNTDNLKGVRS